MRDKVGFVYEQLSVKERSVNYSVALIAVSHMRIYGLAFIVTFAGKALSAQSIYIVYSSLLLITIIALGRPFASPSTTNLELANEFFILILFSLIICQTDLIQQI